MFAHRILCKSLLLIVSLVLAVSVWGGSQPAPVQAAPAALMQFTASGHVIGFGAAQVYVAGLDHALRIEFAGAQEVTPVVSGASTTQTGALRQAQLLGVVTYRDLWRGVSVEYRAVAGNILKSTYMLVPGADATQIRLHYNVPVALNADGTLTLAFASGQMTESAPVAWQEINGARVPVEVAFRTFEVSKTSKVSTVSFHLGAYDAARPLFIDPTLTWNTFLGDSGVDYGYSIAVDGSGNVYVAGYSNASWGSPVRTYTSGFDATAAKLDSSGNLTWNTFLGGSGTDYGNAIAVDGSGNVYIAGYSGASWGSPMRAYYGSGNDAFAAKLDSSGNLTWNTFLGGSGNDNGCAIAVDGSWNVYVAGYSSATWESPVRVYTNYYDAFAAKLYSSGNLTWNTFIGGSGDDFGYAVAVDGSGNVYVAGYSSASWGSPVRAYTSSNDAFAAKLYSSGNLTWNTFLGGSGIDCGNAIAVDGGGNVYVAGYSYASWGSPVRTYYGSGSDAFAAKLDSSGNLTWNTFLGGSGSDYGYAIAVDGSGNVYVAGYSGATWGSPVRAYTNYSDAFAAKLDSSGNLTWNTFLGGSGSDYGYAIAVDGSGNVYVAGYSDATWGSPVRAYTSSNDAFVAKLPPDRAYADAAGFCSANLPCYTSLQTALNNVMTTGTVMYYPGTFSESVSLGETVTVNHAGGGDVTISGALTINAGTFNAPSANTLSLTGDFTNSGGTFNHNSGTVIFSGSGVQNLTSNATAAFNNLTVNASVTLVETVAADNITVNGTLNNNGVIRKSQSIGGIGSYTFGLAGGPINGANLSINVTTDNFTSIQVDRVDSNHPNATTGIQTGYYWDITPNGSGEVNMTLPVAFTPDANDKVCRYTGSGQVWDCAMDSFTSNTITRNGVTTFSAWAAGNNVSPTAVELSDLKAYSLVRRLYVTSVLAGLALIVCTGLILISRKRPPMNCSVKRQL